jgi:hypothetical protein
MSGLMMRQDTTPDAPFIADLYTATPDGFGAEFADKWDRLVQQSCKIALQEYYPILKEHQRLGDIFRYRDLSALIDQILSDK